MYKTQALVSHLLAHCLPPFPVLCSSRVQKTKEKKKRSKPFPFSFSSLKFTSFAHFSVSTPVRRIVMKESASAQQRHGGTWRQERERERRPSHGTINHFKSECLSRLVDRALIRPLIKAGTSHSENNDFFFLLLSPLLNFSVSFTSMGLQVEQSPVVLSCPG